MWWVWWFVVAFALYGLLGAWLWISTHRHEASGPGDGRSESSNHP